MSAPAVARNYAEVLYDLASATDAHLEFGDLIDAVASAITTSPEIQAVLVTNGAGYQRRWSSRTAGARNT